MNFLLESPPLHMLPDKGFYAPIELFPQCHDRIDVNSNIAFIFFPHLANLLSYSGYLADPEGPTPKNLVYFIEIIVFIQFRDTWNT